MQFAMILMLELNFSIFSAKKIIDCLFLVQYLLNAPCECECTGINQQVCEDYFFASLALFFFFFVARKFTVIAIECFAATILLVCTE